MDENCRFVVDKLLSNGFKVYLVGGSVRKKFVNTTCRDIKTDYDIATNAVPNDIIRIFGSGIAKERGKSFGVVIVNGVDVATLRKDRFTARFNAKSCLPVFSDSIYEDLARRDITVNSIAIDLKNGNIIDPLNGIGDAKKGIIRFVGDPYKRIEEDPCRIIRCTRFFALLGGSFEKHTLNALLDRNTYVDKYVDPNRIQIEIMKAMKIDYPSLFFGALHIINALRFVFKSVDTCFNHEHGKHHIENIGEHIMLTGDNLSPRDPILRLAGYLHDVGKPYVYDGASFIKHEKYGANIAKCELIRLHFSNSNIKRISNLIYMHMRPCRSLKKASARKLQKALYELGVDPRDFIRLKLADRKANVRNNANKTSMIKPMLINTGIISKEENLPMRVTDLELSGGDIIDIFDLKPGPIIGEIQRELLDYVITYGEERNNRSHLIDIARLYI